MHSNHGSSSDSSRQNSRTKTCEEFSVMTILLWRTPLCSALTLLGALFFQICFHFYSVIFVLSWTGIVLMAAAAFSKMWQYFRYLINNTTETGASKTVAIVSQTILPHQYNGLHSCVDKRCSEINVFMAQLDAECPCEAEKMSHILFTQICTFLLVTRELIILRKPIQSLKFAILLYFLTLVGQRINFLTLCIITTLGAFIIPKLLELYKAKLLELWEKVRNYFHHLSDRLIPEKCKHYWKVLLGKDN